MKSKRKILLNFKYVPGIFKEVFKMSTRQRKDAFLNRLIILLILLFIVNTYAFGTTYSVLDVRGYLFAEDLNPSDAIKFSQRCSELEYTLDKYLTNTQVTVSAFKKIKGNLVYFTGHGYSGSGNLYLHIHIPEAFDLPGQLPIIKLPFVSRISAKYWKEHDVVNWKNIGIWNSNVKWIFFGACGVLNLNYHAKNWAKTLYNGTHGICGFRGASPKDPDDMQIVERFFDLATGEIASGTGFGGYPFRIRLAWRYANELTDSSAWAVIYHYNNKNDFLWNYETGMGNDYADQDIVYDDATHEIFQLSSSQSSKNISYSFAFLPKVSFFKGTGNFSINIPLDIKIEPMTILEVEKEMYDETLIEKLKKMGQDKTAKKTIWIFESGGIVYMDQEPKDLENFILNRENAQIVAEEFIEEYGGMPKDAYLERVREIKNRSLSNDMEKIKGYIFEYRHKYKDIPISGNGGDGIKVIVNEKGCIEFYFRLWRKPLKEKEEKKLIMDPKSILEKISKGENKLKYDLMESKGAKMDFVYYSKDYQQHTTEMVPAWRIQIDGEINVYVDAYTGELLK